MLNGGWAPWLLVAGCWLLVVNSGCSANYLSELAVSLYLPKAFWQLEPLARPLSHPTNDVDGHRSVEGGMPAAPSK